MPTERSLAWRSCQVLARVLTTLLFDLKVFGRHNVPKRGGVLIVSNHQSNLDPVLMAVRLSRPLNYIAKSELFEGRVGGWLLRRLFNAFPVRQGAGDVGAVKETIQRLQEGHVLNIYPEARAHGQRRDRRDAEGRRADHSPRPRPRGPGRDRRLVRSVAKVQVRVPPVASAVTLRAADGPARVAS